MGKSACSLRSRHALFFSRAFLVILGLFFPIFFLQLDAITHNLDPNFAFYSVRAPPLPRYPWIRID